MGDWQQIISLSIVALSAALLVRNQLQKRKASSTERVRFRLRLQRLCFADKKFFAAKDRKDLKQLS